MSDFFIFISYMIGGSVGAAVGSFLGVVIERNGKLKVEKGKLENRALKFSSFIFHLSSSFGGRSLCLECGHLLAWWENIPVVSFILLKGRCSRCRSPIPSWLPLIEIAGAAGGIWIGSQIWQISPIRLISLILIVAVLTWIFFSDLVYGVISDWAVAIGSVGALLYHRGPCLAFPPCASPAHLLLGAFGAALFFWFLVLITRGRGMGTGDITLAFFLGLLLGWPLIIVGVWLAFVIGAICGIGLIVLGKKEFGQTIPFGPLLIVGAIISSGWGQLLLDKWLWFVVK